VQTEPSETVDDNIGMKAKDAVKVFELFENDVEHDDLTDSERVKGIVKELDDRKDRSLWKTMDGYDERDFSNS